jgi:hypothetical protein
MNAIGPLTRMITIGMILAACRSTPAPTVAPTTPRSASPSAAPTEVLARPLPTAGRLAAGLYFLGPHMKYGTPGVTYRFEVPVDGWVSWGPGVRTATEDDTRVIDLGFTRISNLIADPCRWEAGELMPPIGGTVDALVDALLVQPHFEAGVPSDIVIDGLPGRQVTLTLDDDLDTAACDDAQVFSRIGIHGGMRWHTGRGHAETLWVVNMHGSRLVIFSGAMPNASEADRANLSRIVDSIEIESGG